MITINSYLHRSLLNDVIRRWMYAEVRPSDVNLITKLVNFNNVYVSRYLKLFSENIFSKLHQLEIIMKPARLKKDLKDIIVENPPYRNQRIDDLIAYYRKNPGLFYRETPFQATLYFVNIDGNTEYIGSTRIKRVHRLAEKVARRIIDRMFSRIKRDAENLADERARELGIPRHMLLTSREKMIEEFLEAENRLLDDLRHGREIHDTEPLIINDVAGMKIIMNDDQKDRILSIIEGMDNCKLAEVEIHSGKYNATNIVLGISPPKELILLKPLAKETISLIEKHGFTRETANKEFEEFVLSGEDSVNIEIIVSNYQEMLESEIGRCMHEDRIIEQRLRQEYCGHLAKNIEYLMEYLFVFPSSPRTELVELPIKLWNRYMPDCFDEVLKDLFDIPRVEYLN